MNLQRQTNFSVSGFRVPIRNTADYSPFGVQLDGRTIQGDFYRQGFNGMEKDDEVKGGGNSYDFGARMYDARVGRWLSVDPLASEFSFESNYCFTSNNPIYFIDGNGEFKIPIHIEITLTALATIRPLNYFLIVNDINKTIEQTLNFETEKALEKIENIGKNTKENFAYGLAYGVSIEADIKGCLDPVNHFDGMNFKQIQNNWKRLDQSINEMKINASFETGVDLGKKLHAVEDFYAHSNYVELYVQYYMDNNKGKIPDFEEIPLFQDAISMDNKFKNILKNKLKTGHMDVGTYVLDKETDIEQTHKDGNVHHDDIAKDNLEMGKEIKGKNGSINTFEAAKSLAIKNVTIYLDKKLSKDGQ